MLGSSIIEVRSGEAFPVSTQIIANNLGLAVNLAGPISATVSAATYTVLGVSLEASTAANQLISMVVTNTFVSLKNAAFPFV
jgi:hypothetical protein